MLAAAATAAPAVAQDARAYVVSYIEVAPSAKDGAAAALRQLAAASRKEDGSVRFEVLQRIDRPHHFAVLEVWKDGKAHEAHAAAAGTKELRDRLQSMLAAPYDERPHGGLAAAQHAERPAAGAIYAVTHVDFIPPKKDEGIAALNATVEPSRKDPGNLRYDVLQQTSRPNHLTLVEAWRDQGSLEGHAVAAHTKQFRTQLLPMSGSLFDERLYRSLE
jgi:quinol monooxygenase YgiN